MPVRILLMDIDDTLFDFQTGYKRALRAALAQFGVECTPQLLELYGSINDRLWAEDEHSYCDCYASAEKIMEKKDIVSYNYDELQDEIKSIGEKPFRAKQIYAWLHEKLAEEFDEMTNLSKALREKTHSGAAI